MKRGHQVPNLTSDLSRRAAADAGIAPFAPQPGFGARKNHGKKDEHDAHQVGRRTVIDTPETG